MTRVARISLTLVAVLVLPAVLVVLAVPGTGPAQTKPLRPYTLILDFVPTGEYVPHYTALEKGWYRDEGLDVKIVRGQGSADTVKRIAAGQGEVGISDISALIAVAATLERMRYGLTGRRRLATLTALAAWANWLITLIASALGVRGLEYTSDPANNVIAALLQAFVVLPSLVAAAAWAWGFAERR